jgi:hypothetical protein
MLGGERVWPDYNLGQLTVQLISHFLYSLIDHDCNSLEYLTHDFLTHNIGFIN